MQIQRPHLVIVAGLLLALCASSVDLRAQCRPNPDPDASRPRPALTPPSFSSQATASAPDIVALTTDNRLLRFNSAEPGKIISEIGIRGLGPGENIIAIDYCPADTYLYGLSNNGYLYSIHEQDGLVDRLIQRPLSLKGTKKSFDFDPKDGAARILSDVGQNETLSRASGLGFYEPLLDDPILAYVAGDPNAAVRPNIVSLAYDNNYFRADTRTGRNRFTAGHVG